MKTKGKPQAGKPSPLRVDMPHPGHFICSQDCRFHLNTYVSGYIVSTVGEMLPDSGTWHIYAKSKGVTLEGQGDARRADFLKRVGFVEIGAGRTYETMVFHAQKSGAECCPWEMASGGELDFEGYSDPGKAFSGHQSMVAGWAG